MEENNTIKLCSCNCKHETFESEQTNELATALAKAQAEFEIPVYDDYGHFKSPNKPEGNPFCTLTSLTTATRLALTKYGLSVETKIISDESGDYHCTILRHSSGQWSKSKVRIIQDKAGLHGLAAANTYLTRMGYGNAVGAARGEYDNDAGDGKVEVKQEYKSIAIRDHQVEQISKLSDEDINYILTFFKVKSVFELNQDQYKKIAIKYGLK